MGTTNVANWDVSYIDANGAYNGDVTGDLTGDVTGDLTGNVTGNVTGDVYGPVTVYSDESVTLAATDRASLLNGLSNAVLATLPSGLGAADGKIMRVCCVNATNNCTVQGGAVHTSITLDAVNEYAELVYSSTNGGWFIVSTNGTVNV